jgi:hypothetical protein
VELRSGPSDQRLLWSRPSPAVSSESKCWFRIQITGYRCWRVATTGCPRLLYCNKA